MAAANHVQSPINVLKAMLYMQQHASELTAVSHDQPVHVVLQGSLANF